MNRFFLVGLLMVAASQVACSPDDPRISMTPDQRFSPAEVEVKVGNVVTWINGSRESHTVTAYQEDFPEGADYLASGGAPDEAAAREEVGKELVPPDDVFEFTFTEPGTYRYFCIPHEGAGMTGTITVTD